MDLCLCPREIHEATDYGAMAQADNTFNTLLVKLLVDKLINTYYINSN